MYLVAWTYTHPEEGVLDRFVLYDTRSEARAFVDTTLLVDDRVYCWALTKVEEASEPHWVPGYWDDPGFEMRTAIHTQMNNKEGESQ